MFRIRSSVALALALALAVTPISAGALAATPAPASRAADGDVTWSVEPVQTPGGVRRSFEYSVDPGTQIVDSVVITNAGSTPAEFLIYATDAINERDTGAFGLLERDAEPTDVGAWITTGSDALTIEPGMQAIVPFNLLIPSDAAPGEHVAGIIASVVTTGESEGAAVELEQRVAARVYLTVSGAVESALEIEGVSSSFASEFNPFAPGAVDVSYTVRNSGNVRVDVSQTIVVNGPFGIRLAEFTPEPFRELLPRQTVRVDASIPAVFGLFAAFSTIEVTPGAVGSTDAPAEDEVVLEPEESTTDPSAEPAAEVGDVEVIADATAVDYASVSETTFAVAISWTLLALVVLVLALIYLAWRYVSGTRERLYLAIDEAAAAARAESAAHDKDNSTDTVGV